MMKLTFWGNTYEILVPSQLSSDLIDQPKIKLIYRGHTYYTTPRPVVVPEAVEADGSTVTLIYRGHTYERTLPPAKPYQKPRAINWRYQMLGEG